jgi:hypothetical protein
MKRASAVGPLLSLNSRFACSGAATGHPGRAQRLGEAVFAALRLPCAARARGPVAQLPPFAALTVVEPARRVSSRSALCARAPNPVLLGASHARRALPGCPVAEAAVLRGTSNTDAVAGKAPGGVRAHCRVRSREAQACWPRASARFVNMFVAACLNVASAASEVSSATGQQGEHRRVPSRSEGKQSALCPHPARRLARADAGIRKRTFTNGRIGPQADNRPAPARFTSFRSRATRWSVQDG